MTRNQKTRYPPPPPPLPPPLSTLPFPQQRSSSNTKPSFVNTMIEGFAFGTGSSIARETVNRIFHSSSENKVESKNTITCEEVTNAYNKCILENNHDCQYLFLNMEKICSVKNT